MNRAVVVAGLVAGAFVWLAPGAGANDSSAELAAGGIRLVPNWDIRMEREDLYLSPEEVRVRYVFRNTTDEPIRLLVAFPLPDVDMSELFDAPIDIPDADADNFVDFRVTVNGVAVEPAVEQRAIAQGIDRSDMLRELGIPLNPFAQATYDALEAVDSATRADLVRLGIAHSYEPHDPLAPFWTLRTVFHWEQDFAPGTETIVEHSYRPVVGQSFFGTFVFENDYSGHVERYCIDRSTEAGIRKRLADTGADYLIEHRLGYILTTARNWQGPIGTFRLVIDKTDPSWLVSLCIDGIRKIGPTQFEFVASDFIPEEDLKVLFLAPAAN